MDFLLDFCFWQLEIVIIDFTSVYSSILLNSGLWWKFAFSTHIKQKILSKQSDKR